MTKAQLMEYCKTIEERNLKLRREIDEVKRGSEDLCRLADAILAEVVKQYGDIEIDMPKLGTKVSFEIVGEKFRISTKKDAQEPYSCGEETCQQVNTNQQSHQE